MKPGLARTTAALPFGGRWADAGRTGHGPGPMNSPSALSPQVGSRPTASSYSFGSGRDAMVVGAPSSRGTDAAGPASYSPRVSRTGESRGLLDPDWERSASRSARQRERPSLDRAPLSSAEAAGPGPAGYAPNIDYVRRTSTSVSIPRTSKESPLVGEQGGKAPEETPGPYSTALTRRAVGPIGTKASGSTGFSMCGKDNSPRYISKLHSRNLRDPAGPGPGAYTPREMMGVVDETCSNTSTHAPAYSFGTSTRFDRAMGRLASDGGSPAAAYPPEDRPDAGRKITSANRNKGGVFANFVPTVFAEVVSASQGYASARDAAARNRLHSLQGSGGPGGKPAVR